LGAGQKNIYATIGLICGHAKTSEMGCTGDIEGVNFILDFIPGEKEIGLEPGGKEEDWANVHSIPNHL
jgi:hypothetical protein